ncbi:MAG: hypothetical protein ORO03_04415, partial [Alphaproteobacteria bacterium]|nr:hypothetical protein [Alphaproteobacteria bacterium]
MTESQVITLAAGPWLPDLPALNSPGVTVAKNLLPISSRGYAPMPSFVPLSQPIPGRIVGLFSTKDRNGNPYNLVGTDGGILRLDGASLNWQPMIPVEQFKGSSEGLWAMVTYGEQLICSNGNDPIYSLRMGVDSLFSPLSTDPDVPIAKYLAVVRDWLVAANLRGSDDRAYPQRIQWSGIDDPTDWPPPGSDQAIAKQSDFQELVGSGGEIQGIVGNLGSADAAIFQERAIFRMTFVGPPAIFSFHQVEGARGTAAPGSIVSVG